MHSTNNVHSDEQKFKIGVIDFTAGSLGDSLKCLLMIRMIIIMINDMIDEFINSGHFIEECIREKNLLEIMLASWVILRMI